MKDLGSFLMLVGVLWASGVVFVALCMGIVKFLELLESSDDY